MSKNSLDLAFGTDDKKTAEGVVIEYRHKAATVKLRIMPALGELNPELSRIVTEKFQPYRRAFANDAMDPKAAMSLMQESFAESGIVAEWDVMQDGAPLPCTAANVLDAFKRLPGFFRFVKHEAEKEANFQSDAIEADAKN